MHWCKNLDLECLPAGENLHPPFHCLDDSGIRFGSPSFSRKGRDCGLERNKANMFVHCVRTVGIARSQFENLKSQVRVLFKDNFATLSLYSRSADHQVRAMNMQSMLAARSS